MKRITIIIMALLCGAFLFAETGYAGTQWYSPMWKVIQEKGLQKTDPEIKKEELTCNYQNKNILGEVNNIYYVNNSGYLYSVFYVINNSKVEELKNKFHTKAQEYYSENSYDLENDENYKNINSNSISHQINYTLIETALELIGETTVIEQVPAYINYFCNEPDKEKAKATLYIYDYNNDTRVYIYDNFIKDKAVVVYVPHEQDY